VIGLPDDLHGEEVCAVVVRAPDRAPDAAEVTEWSKEHLGRHKYPRRVEFADELPLGPSMKVLKRELRVRYAGRTGSGR
ncbi:AMP-binding enzyme, partial [Streptomyces ardesiacus]